MHQNFAGMIEAFGPSRTLIGANYPGSGQSATVPGDLTLDMLADRLVATTVAAGHERFPVVGISLGAAVAVTAAHRHPERVTGLALAVGFAAHDAQIRAFSQTWESLDEAGQWDALGQFMLLTVGTAAVLETLSESSVRAAIAHSRTFYPREAVKQAALARTVDIRSILAAVDVPTQVYVSSQDRIVLPSSSRALAAGIPGATVVEYPTAGHIFTPEEDAVWVSDVAAFLTRHKL